VLIQTLLTVNQVAEFSITQVSFNPVGTYLACSSVANSIAFIALDETLGQTGKIPKWVVDNQLVVIGILLVIVILYLATPR
jgi:hypothetical protein